MRDDSPAPPPAFLAGGGDLGALMRAKDWSRTPLGPPEGWSPVLRTLVALVLSARQPMFVAWGPQLCFLYNDAYAPLLGAKHPHGLGRPFAEVWSDIWPQFGPIVEATLAGEAQAFDDLPVPMSRHGYPETPYFSFSYTQLRDENDAVAGLFCAVTETTAKVLAEHEVVAEKTRLRELFEQAPGFMAVLRSPDHVFELLNAAYLQLVGHRDLLGKPVREALPEVEGQGFFELLDGVYASGEPFVGRQLRLEIQRRPGSELETRYVDFVYQPIVDAGGQVTGIFVEGSDVTDSYEAQEALREERDRSEAAAASQAAILGQLAEGVVVTDSLGRITFVNEAATRLHGVAALDVAPEAYSDTYHLLTLDGAPYPPEELPLSRAVLRGETITDARWRIARPDGAEVLAVGSARPVYAPDGAKLGAVLTLRDDTARLRAEAELREFNETLESRVAEALAERNRLWMLSEDMLARADYEGGLSAVSPAWTTVLGYSETELLTRPYAEIIHPGDVDTVVTALNAMRETGQPTRFDNRILAADGGWKPIGWTVSPEPDGVNFIAVGRDMSQEKARERELEEAQEQLRQAQKMEAVGQLTGGIAHDFNNLLQGITGSLDLVQKRIAQGRVNELDRFISGAVASAHRAAALTHRLLAFSRRQPLDPKPVKPNPLVAGMEDLLRRTLGETIDLELVLAGGLWLTLCDANQLESAILNLAINARDAMPEGGKLTIETCNAHLDSAYAARSRDVRPGQYVCICVTDSGTGMAPEVIERAFDPFFTTKAIGQGTGLGLSMIYGFARQSEGYCKIYSEVGRGTTIKLYLPRHRGKVVEEDPALGLTEAQAAEHGEVVVVVEDEAVVRGLIVEVLADLGYRALEAHDGPSGVALLDSAPRVDLLITDIGLPGMNGRQLADAARAQRPGLKVLFMTGYAENAAIANGFLEPGMSMLTKPFAMESLATRIRSILEGE